MRRPFPKRGRQPRPLQADASKRADRVRQLLLLLLAAVAAAVSVSTLKREGLVETGQTTKPTPPADVAWAVAPMGARLPELRFLVTGPPELKRVSVSENGVPVEEYSLTSVGDAKDARFGVVLAIDSSLSMRDSIGAALEAARALVGSRNDNQAMAVMFFDSETHLLQPLTTDEEALGWALTHPPTLSYGTRIYDAVAAAARLIEQADVSAGTVVLLSDGADVGSQTTLSAALKATARAKTRVFTVGLNGPDFTPESLRELAARSRGVYSEAASTADLDRIYERLGSQLAAEYVLSYRSRAHAGQLVDLSVTGPGGQARTTYVTPLAVDGAEVAKPAGGLFGLLVLVVPGLAVFLVVFLLLNRRQRSAGSRISSFLPSEDRKKEDEATGKDPLLAALLNGNPLRRLRWWRTLERDLELAQVKTPPGKIALAAASMLVLSLFLAAAASPVWAGLAVLIPVSLRVMIKHKLAKRRKEFAEQLPDTLQVLASALRAGHSLASALQVVVDDAVEPSRGEYQRVLADERLGVPLDEALHAAARRLNNEELEQVAVVAFLQQQTGGNIAEVLDRVVETVRGRTELKRRVNALTAQGKLARWVVSLLPIGLGLFLTLLNPDYTAPLYTTLAGQGILVFSALMIVSGSFIIKKIVEIEV